MAVQSKLEEAACREWSGLRSSAAYLDTCSGSSNYIIKVVDSIVSQATWRYVIGVTLLGRGNSAEANEGCITARLVALDAYMVRQGFRKIGRSDRDAVSRTVAGRMSSLHSIGGTDTSTRGKCE